MTSFQSLYMSILSTSDAYKQLLEKDKQNAQDNSRIRQRLKTSFERNEHLIFNSLSKDVQYQLKCFNQNYQTIGNFTIVPCGFNTARANFGQKDSWDITLFYIEKYFESRQFEDGFLAGRNINDVIINTKEWLSNSEHNNFSNFCNHYFFQMFLDDNKNIEFFCDYHKANKQIPPINQGKLSEKELIELLDNISTIIENRTKKICCELEKKLTM